MVMNFKMRKIVLTVVAVGIASLMGGAAQTAPATVATPAASDLETQIEKALRRGDIAAVKKLTPGPTASQKSAMYPFTNRPDPAGKTQITDFEELKACGFYPEETRLECTIEIKRTTGYDGPIGDLGALEHVSFCVFVFSPNYIGWYPLGVGSVQIHDESPQSGGSPPWHYAVYRDFNPLGKVRVVSSNAQSVVTTQTMGRSFWVEAILSYWMPVNNCSAVPQYGNVLYFNVRADPIR